MLEKLSDPKFMGMLRRLSFRARRAYYGYTVGEQRSRRRGSGIEFLDHREYQPGDDYRHIDWNLLSRLDRVFVKLFVEESDLAVYILVDSSRSMDFGRPTKFEYAKLVAGALAYVGLVNSNRVMVGLLDADSMKALPPGRGKAHMVRVRDFLEQARCGGRTALDKGLGEFALANKGRGLVILLSDLLDESGFAAGVKTLRGLGFQVGIIQVLSQEELFPGGSGEFLFMDSETGEEIRVTLDAGTLEIYRSALDEFFRGIEDFCVKSGVEYVRTTTAVPPDALILDYLRQGGILV